MGRIVVIKLLPKANWSIVYLDEDNQFTEEPSKARVFSTRQKAEDAAACYGGKVITMVGKSVRGEAVDIPPSSIYISPDWPEEK